VIVDDIAYWRKRPKKIRKIKQTQKKGNSPENKYSIKSEEEFAANEKANRLSLRIKAIMKALGQQN
jgi:hypothetical protein